MRRPLPVALGVAMPASATPGMRGEPELQRVFQFLPCFVLGLCLKPEHFRLVRRRSARILSVPVLAPASAFGWWSVSYMDARWVYRNSAAQDLGAPW